MDKAKKDKKIKKKKIKRKRITHLIMSYQRL